MATVTPAGIEPCVSALKGPSHTVRPWSHKSVREDVRLRVSHVPDLQSGAVATGPLTVIYPGRGLRPCYAVFLPCTGISTISRSSLTSKSYCQDNQVIYRWHCGAILPFVNGLRCCKSKDFLQVLYGHSCRFHHSCDIFPGCCHIDRRHFVFSFSHQKKPSAHQDKRFMRKDIYHA